MFIPRLGEWLEIGKGVLKVLKGTEDAGYVPPKPPEQPPETGAPDQALPRADRDLSPHFGIFVLTKTNNAALQAKNRILTDEQLTKAHVLALLMEQVRTIMGCAVDVHSGYRCPELNAATTKAAKKSQHMLFEACDWSPVGPDDEAAIEAAFAKVLAAAKRGEIKFGQLIIEKAQRGFSKSVWVHISLGLPYRDPARCGEAMRMVEQNGEQVYTLVEKVPQ